MEAGKNYTILILLVIFIAKGTEWLAKVLLMDEVTKKTLDYLTKNTGPIHPR